jgi:hypothetical protein
MTTTTSGPVGARAGGAPLNNIHVVDYCTDRVDAILALRAFQRSSLQAIAATKTVDAASCRGSQQSTELDTLVTKKRQRDFGNRCERRRTTSIVKYRIPTYRKLQAAAMRAQGTAFRHKRIKMGEDTVRVRKHRRRPRDLLDIHRFRPQMELGGGWPNDIWLETHIWHSKRMKMGQLWGHRLGLHHAGRGMRFLRKAVKESCVVHDMSYYHEFMVEAATPDHLFHFLSRFMVSFG